MVLHALPPAVQGFARSFSLAGLLLATLFFAASLSPSLIPRSPVVQGAVSGVCLAAGYGIGVALGQIWRYLQLPRWGPGPVPVLAAAGICLGIAFWFLWRASDWQNAIRSLMELEPVETSRPLEVASLAILLFLILVLIARLFGWLFRTLSRRLARHVPPRISRIVGFTLALALFWGVANGVLLNVGLRMSDGVYKQLDLMIEDGILQPEEPMKTGSPASLVSWASLGRAGREMVARGPTRAEIEAFSGVPALEPIRVYVGLNAAETPAERADLALRELLRVGAFERSVLVITTPTGTGWVDPESQIPLEYLHHGDVASVVVQYSYLTSVLALLFEPDYGRETAEALFDAVYGHWTALPRDARPRLYLHGLSLGALNSDLSADLFKVIGDPHDGALWAGPPFPSRTWGQVTAMREPGSPQRLPRFRDGSLIRFTAQQNHLDEARAPWGAMRIVYLQYASDPVVFFDPAAWYRPPAWMRDPRAPDVAPQFRWYPVVTLFQLTLDMATATTTPMGYGHIYTAPHYIDAWRAVTEPEGWDEAQIARLKRALRGGE